MKKILWITTIPPSEINRGKPSGLPLEIITTLEEYDIDVDEKIVDVGNTFLSQKLQNWGIYFHKYKCNFDNYDFIFSYPNTLANFIPKKYWNKVISIGPDASSLLFHRMKNVAVGISRLKYLIYEVFFSLYEKKWSKYLRMMCVVGMTDKQWLESHTRYGKVKYIVHPLLRSSINKERGYFYVNSSKRFVFSGGLNKFYVGNYVDEMCKVINHNKYDFNILVIGENNKWVYDKFSLINTCHCTYLNWIEKYEEVCIKGQDIHCVPLMAGAGTKNRVLIALANGVTVISTPIGIENIEYNNMSSVFVCAAPIRFVETMNKINKGEYVLSPYDRCVEESINFRKAVTKKYNQSILNILQEVGLC